MSDTHRELRQTIVTAFRKFSMDPHHSPLKNQKDREIAGRFIDRLHTNTFDASNLPYYTSDGKAKRYNKSECVFAMMCDIVLKYWYLVQSSLAISGHVADTITNKLILLDRVYKEYDQLKVLGDDKGYYLIGIDKTEEQIDRKLGRPTAQEVIANNLPDIPIDPPRPENFNGVA